MSTNHRPSRTSAFVLHTIVILVVLAAGAGLPSPSHALGFAIQVNSTADNLNWDGWCTLREAIVNANSDAASPDCTRGGGEDGIFFSDALGTATITLNSVLPAIHDADGLLIDGGGDITLSGNNAVQVFTVTNTGLLTLKGLIVKDGESALTSLGAAVYNRGVLSIDHCTLFGNNASLGGGAIFNTQTGSLTVTHSSFANNSTGGSGGGIYNENGEVSIHNSNFTGNTAAVRGGAVYNLANSGDVLNVTDTGMTGNVAAEGAGIYHTNGNLFVTASDLSSNFGEGIFNQRGHVEIVQSSLNGNDGDGMFNEHGVVLVTQGSFSGNTGNGVYNEHGYVEVAQGVFEGNHGNGIHNWSDLALAGYAEIRVSGSSFLKNAGSGVYNDSAKNNIKTTTFYANQNSGIHSGNDSLVTVWLSTFLKNSARYGGGIHNEDSLLHALNNTFSENMASVKGGGVANLNHGSVYSLSNTFSGNIGKLHDGLYNDPSGTVALHNTILANGANNGDDCRNDPGGTLTGNNNLIEALTGNACGLVNGVDGNLIGLDPKLDSLTGSPAYHPFAGESPAIDAGDDVQCAAVSNQSQNGAPRPQGSHCDIGSYEQPSEQKALSPREAIVELSQEVRSLADAGALTADNAKVLTSILEGAVRSLDQGDSDSGLKLLNSFIDQVNALIKSRDLGPAQGQALIDKTRTILDSIE